MPLRISTEKARQGDRGWSMARALIIAIIVGAIALVLLQIWGAVFQPDDENLRAPVPQVTEPAEPGAADTDPSEELGQGD